VKPGPKIVTAFTHADDERWLPPAFVVGELDVRHVPALNYDQYLVDGASVDESTVMPIPDPTPELVRVLKAKSSEWARHDRSLAKRRARRDDSFREKREDNEFGVHLVREDRSEAFGAFCDEMSKENQRLTDERQAEVADLVRNYNRESHKAGSRGPVMAKSHATKEQSARRTRSIRRDSCVGSAEREIERVFGLPEGSVKLVNPDGTDARSDKYIRAFLADWGW
jgi:hypothetical protein